MATYNDDGTHTYVPGESNDRAVPADPPVDPDAPAPDPPTRKDHTRDAHKHREA
jgi:hypothetical protein